MKVVIFGCGGVGSHLAYMLAHANHDSDEKKLDEIVLVDFDRIEEKNAKRQLFLKEDAGQLKSDVLIKRLRQVDDDIEVSSMNMKINSMNDLFIFNPITDLAMICVDEAKAKMILGKFFKNFLMAGCDKDYYEVRNFLNDSDKNVFQFRGANGAYNSSQTFSSNISAAMEMYQIFREEGLRISGKTIDVKAALGG